MQDEVIARLAPVEVIDIASGHLPMITRPEEVAAAIHRVVTRLQGRRA